MSGLESFDQDAFQTRVLGSVKVLQQTLPRVTRHGDMSHEDREALKRILELDLGYEQANLEVERFTASGQLSPSATEVLNRKTTEISQANKTATEVVKQVDFKQYICTALQSVANDAFEIAKIITPILVPLVLTGTLPIPPDPMIIGAIAVVIARMGISTFCKEYEKKKEK